MNHLLKALASLENLDRDGIEYSVGEFKEGGCLTRHEAYDFMQWLIITPEEKTKFVSGLEEKLRYKEGGT